MTPPGPAVPGPAVPRPAVPRPPWIRLVNGWLASLAVVVLIPSIAVIFDGRVEPRLVVAAAIPIVVGSLSLLFTSQGRGHRHSRLAGGPYGRLVGSPYSRLAGQSYSRLAGGAVAVAVLVGLTPAGPDGRGALAGLATGPARLITATLPAVPAGPELGIALVAVALAAGLAMELGGSDRRLAPLLPAVVLYLTALLVGGGGQSPPAWDAVLIVGVSAISLAVRMAQVQQAGPATAGAPAGDDGPRIAGHRGPRSGPSRGQVVARVAAVGAVTALAVPLGRHLPGASARAPYDLRAARRCPRPVRPSRTTRWPRTPRSMTAHPTRVRGPGRRRRPPDAVLAAHRS